MGITLARQKISKVTDIPSSKAGLEREIGSVIVKTLVGKMRAFISYNNQRDSYIRGRNVMKESERMRNFAAVKT